MTEFKYGGFWKRFLAHLIDQILLGFISSVILIPIIIVFGYGIFSQFNHIDDLEFKNVSFQPNDLNHFSFAEISMLISAILFFALISIIISWLYYSLMESSKKQATVGKMLLNLQVTDLSGNRISFGRATGRYFAKILSGLFLGIGYLLMLFSARKQTLHDMISGCIIIDSNYMNLQKILNENTAKASPEIN